MSFTMWPRNARQHQVADLLGVRRAGLGELAGDATDLHRGHPRRVGEHHGHLQDDLQLVADGIGAERLERLGAVSRLEQERLAVGHLAELGGEVACLAREHQRGQRAHLLEHRVECRLVWPVGLLGGRALSPGGRGPRGV
jgi:hypothetical protein